jgi:hypothetical protein
MAKRATRNKRSQKKRSQRGGAVLSPADVADTSMAGPSQQSLNQGKDYASIHAGQHGGGAYQYLNQAPPGSTGVLDQSLRGSAHLLPADASWQAASGMSDQAGGARGRSFSWKSLQKRFGNTYKKVKRFAKKAGRFAKKSFRNTYKKASRFAKKASRFAKKASRFVKKAAKSKKASKASKKQRGGSYQYADHADYSSPGTLLPPQMEAKALGGMNPEWKLSAGDFLPK